MRACYPLPAIDILRAGIDCREQPKHAFLGVLSVAVRRSIAVCVARNLLSVALFLNNIKPCAACAAGAARFRVFSYEGSNTKDLREAKVLLASATLTKTTPTREGMPAQCFFTLSNIPSREQIKPLSADLCPRSLTQSFK